ncbi:MAG TPA: Ig-like domain-containing protein, partial [Verrucomicrobiae bacterium]|nr:Ig-like domain-containing protein [Verrucomicrobiae bacterium]
NPNERYDEWIFSPCPAWEWVSYKNTCNRAITISSVRAGSLCSSVRPSFHSLLAQGLRFGAPGPGATLTNEFINQVMLFPQTVAINTSAPMTFSAPTNSGNWTASPIYMDPFGNPAPLGGVLYTSDGPGLDPSMLCNFSFAMQGPADLQYTMYAYDSLMAEFQEYNLDLRPTLTITPGNNVVELDFNSVPGLNYILQGSADLHTWSPLQTFSGTGGSISGQTPMNGSMGFFRLGCQPAPLPGNPPVVSAITADALSNALTITFSEPVDSPTAANPANYFVGSSLGGTLTESPLQVRPDAVTLMLNTPLMPGVNYYLGVTGVSDTNGNVMVPATFPFAAATLQTPCAGGELLVRQAYSECNSDGFWHVVEDDYYACPPAGAVQKFRVADTKTTQPCATNTPSPVGLLYPTAADVASTCQSPVLIGQVTVYECVGGLWSASTYLKYQCLDGTIYLSGPIANVPVNPPTGCSQPPPGPGSH